MLTRSISRPRAPRSVVTRIRASNFLNLLYCAILQFQPCPRTPTMSAYITKKQQKYYRQHVACIQPSGSVYLTRLCYRHGKIGGQPAPQWEDRKGQAEPRFSDTHSYPQPFRAIIEAPHSSRTNHTKICTKTAQWIGWRAYRSVASMSE